MLTAHSNFWKLSYNPPRITSEIRCAECTGLYVKRLLYLEGCMTPWFFPALAFYKKVVWPGVNHNFQACHAPWPSEVLQPVLFLRKWTDLKQRLDGDETPWNEDHNKGCWTFPAKIKQADKSGLAEAGQRSVLSCTLTLTDGSPDVSEKVANTL